MRSRISSGVALAVSLAGTTASAEPGPTLPAACARGGDTTACWRQVRVRFDEAVRQFGAGRTGDAYAALSPLATSVPLHHPASLVLAHHDCTEARPDAAQARLEAAARWVEPAQLFALGAHFPPEAQLTLWRAAARRGSNEAALALAARSMQADAPHDAYRWFAVAAQRGHEGARDRLARWSALRAEAREAARRAQTRARAEDRTRLEAAWAEEASHRAEQQQARSSQTLEFFVGLDDTPAVLLMGLLDAERRHANVIWYPSDHFRLGLHGGAFDWTYGEGLAPSLGLSLGGGMSGTGVFFDGIANFNLGVRLDRSRAGGGLPPDRQPSLTIIDLGGRLGFQWLPVEYLVLAIYVEGIARVQVASGDFDEDLRFTLDGRPVGGSESYHEFTEALRPVRPAVRLGYMAGVNF